MGSILPPKEPSDKAGTVQNDYERGVIRESAEMWNRTGSEHEQAEEWSHGLVEVRGLDG